MSDDQTPSAGEPAKSKRAAPDERDLAIERLERELAEERQNAVTLRESTDGLRFQIEILEKSYSKQLADARVRADTAERELAEQRARVAQFGAGGEETLRMLEEARAELARVTSDNQRLRKQVAQRDGVRADSVMHEDSASLTINELLTSVSVLRERQSPPAQQNADQQEQARVEAEPLGDMLAPELVFTKSSKDDEA